MSVLVVLSIVPSVAAVAMRLRTPRGDESQWCLTNDHSPVLLHSMELAQDLTATQATNHALGPSSLFAPHLVEFYARIACCNHDAPLYLRSAPPCAAFPLRASIIRATGIRDGIESTMLVCPGYGNELLARWPAEDGNAKRVLWMRKAEGSADFAACGAPDETGYLCTAIDCS